jgi:biopolymer transport protein ExbB
MAAASHGAQDLRFTAADGATVLPHETERFDEGTGALAAWVGVPELSASEPTVLYLYYGNESAPDGQQPADVWSGYAGVWHLDHDFDDSTSFANHGAPADNHAPPSFAAGVVGRAADFDGVNDALLIGDPEDGSLDFGTASFSYSLWARVEQSAGVYDMPWAKGGTSNTVAGYHFELGTDWWLAGVSDGAVMVGTDLGSESAFLGRWVYLAVVVDRDGAELITYVDGAKGMVANLEALGGSVDTTQSAYISHDAYPFRGRIEEVRVVPTALTDAWIETVYATMTSPESFLTWGTEELAR